MAAVAARFANAAPTHAQEAPTQPPPTSRPWRVDLTAGAGYDDNIRFTPSMESAVSGRLRAGLTRLVRSPRANLTLGATGEGLAYRQAPEFNRINYGADLSGAYLVSPRTTIRIGDSFSKGYAGDSPVLLEAGLLFPRTVSRSNDAFIEVSHQISPRWNWKASARHQLILFDSPMLRDGSTLIGRAELSWASSRSFPIGLYYELRRMRAQDLPNSDTHGAALRGERRFGETFSLRLELGAHKVNSQRTDSGRVLPTAAAGLAARSRKQSIDAEVVRSVTEAFGLGRMQVTSAATLRLTRTLTSRLTLALSGNLTRSADPDGIERLAFLTGVLGGELKFRFAQEVEFSAGGGYRRLDPVANASTHSRFATLAVRVGQTW